MEFFQLGIKGKDYPVCWHTWGQLANTAVTLTWEPSMRVAPTKGATATLIHVLCSGQWNCGGVCQLNPSRHLEAIKSVPVLPFHLLSGGGHSDALIPTAKVQGEAVCLHQV